MKAKTGDLVEVHFTGFLEDGTVFDTSKGKEPIQFVMGSDEVIPGFSQGISGMRLGEIRRIELPPEHAYGEYHDELIRDFPISNFEGGVEEGVTVHGMVSGEVTTGMILKIIDNTVLVDFNHPLAGKRLIFEVELINNTRH
ncbi:MAG: FKBP-type peptidyl-prolyl cis-trans isomerase [Candidatus Woesearchaeota archaeon]|jgi:peptidylprolyl isomerase